MPSGTARAETRRVTDTILVTDLFQDPRLDPSVTRTYSVIGSGSGVTYSFRTCGFLNNTYLYLAPNDDIGLVTLDNPREATLESIDVLGTYATGSTGQTRILFYTSDTPFTATSDLYSSADLTEWERLATEEKSANKKDYTVIPSEGYGPMTRLGISSTSQQVVTGFTFTWRIDEAYPPIGPVVSLSVSDGRTHYTTDGVGTESLPIYLTTADQLTLNTDSDETLLAVVTDEQGNRELHPDARIPMRFNAKGAYTVSLYTPASTPAGRPSAGIAEVPDNDFPELNDATHVGDIHVRVVDTVTAVTSPAPEQEADSLYDLSGRPVSPTGRPKGIYIRRNASGSRLEILR
ncbi:MAG: hypothetical protein K2O24_00185 [Muribaculaceae bacterium]|nr:hypothetical protein [Muribaculaceae bacterium]